MLRKCLEKLHNFRLLPVFVIVSMFVGIAVGKWYGISNFALTCYCSLKYFFPMN